MDVLVFQVVESVESTQGTALWYYLKLFQIYQVDLDIDDVDYQFLVSSRKATGCATMPHISFHEVVLMFLMEQMVFRCRCQKFHQRISCLIGCHQVYLCPEDGQIKSVILYIMVAFSFQVITK